MHKLKGKSTLKFIFDMLLGLTSWVEWCMLPELVRFCEELQARLCAEGDPAHGKWSVNREAECILSTDASDIAYLRLASSSWTQWHRRVGGVGNTASWRHGAAPYITKYL